MQTKRYPAQIMIITLITLMVLGTIVVGVATTASRDVTQTVISQSYEQLYNVAEEQLFTFVDKYAKANTSGQLPALTVIRNDFPTQCNASYVCTFYQSNNEIRTEATVRDTANFNGYEIAKDDVLTLNINNYRGEIRLSWAGTAAMELGLIYTDSLGEYKSIRDIFDKAGVLTSAGNDPFVNGANDGHAIVYQSYLSPNTNSFRFTINNVLGLGVTDTPRLLTLTPRMSGDGGSVSVNFAYDSATPQMREFSTAAAIVAFPYSPIPSVRALVPLYPQVTTAFNGYALLVNSQVTK